MSEQSNTNKKPSHIAYHVRDGKGEDSYWNRSGVAWQHKDAKGFDVQINVAPLDGRIVLRLPSSK